MKICDNCGKRLESNSIETIKFPIITVRIEAILDPCWHTKKIDLCQ